MDGVAGSSAGASAAAVSHPAGVVSHVSSSAATHAHSAKGGTHPSRLRRMSTPASMPEQQADDFLKSLADSAYAAAHMERLEAPCSAEQLQEPRGCAEQQQLAGLQEVAQSSACCTGITSTMLCVNPGCVRVAAAVAAGHMAPADMAAADGVVNSPRKEAHADISWNPAGSSSSSSSNDISNNKGYLAALAATQQLPWPASWHWPHKMAYANAAGVRYIDVCRPDRSISACRSTTALSKAGRRSPSPTLSGYNSSSSSGSGSSSAAGCKVSSGRSSPDLEQQQQQQWKPSEVLLAIHAHLAASPAVSAAVTAAVTSPSRDTAAAAAPEPVAAAAAVHSCLQQQFAQAFAGWDVDGNGLLDAAELRGMLSQVLPPGTAGMEEARYCQILLDRSGCGAVSAPDLLAAAATAVRWQAGICPKPRVDVNDVLLQLVLQLQQQEREQEQQQQCGQASPKHRHNFVSLARLLFQGCLDDGGSGRLGPAELARLFRRALPGLQQRDITFMCSHMSELDPEGTGQVSLKQLLAALQPVHHTLQAVQQPGSTGAGEAGWWDEAVPLSVTPQQQQQQHSLSAATLAMEVGTMHQASAEAASADMLVQPHNSITSGPAAPAASAASPPPSSAWEALHSGGGSGWAAGRGSSRSVSQSSSCSSLSALPVSRRRRSIADSDDSLSAASSPRGPFTPVGPGQQQQQDGQQQLQEGQQDLQQQLLQKILQEGVQQQQEGQQDLQQQLVQKILQKGVQRLQDEQQAQQLLQPLAITDSQHAGASTSTEAGAAPEHEPPAAAGAVTEDPSAAWQLPPGPAPVRVQSQPRLDSSSRCNAGSSSAGAVLTECSQQLVLPVLWPMQELAAVLASNPVAMQLAFMHTAAACSSSSQHMDQPQPHQPTEDGSTSSSPSSSQQLLQQLPAQQQQRYSLVPIAALPQLLAAAMPGWGGADVSYAALQIRCHLNIVTAFCIDTPKAADTNSSSSPIHSCGSMVSAGSNGGVAAAAVGDAPVPTDFMYAELAATIVSAAATEAVAAAGELPAAVQQLVVDLAVEVTSNAEAYARLQEAWQQSACHTAAAAAAQGEQGVKLPVVAGVRLLCKQLVASLGLADMRLLGWLTCLVRQQHLGLQLAAIQSGNSSSSTDHEAGSSGQSQKQQGQHAGVLVGELGLGELVEALVALVQGLLTPDDAELVEELRQQQQQHHEEGDFSSCMQQGSWHADGDKSWVQAGEAAGQAAAAAGAGTPELAVPARRQRIVFCGRSSCGSSASSSPSWLALAQQQQQQQHRGSFGGELQHHLHDLHQQRQMVDSGYFQPVHCGGHDSGLGNGLSISNAAEDGCPGTGATAEEVTAAAGVSLVPAALQQQGQQMQRLRAAQQQAWHAEMLLQHQPWEGAYSPVAAAAAAAGGSSSGGGSYFAVTHDEFAGAGRGDAAAAAAASKARQADILRLSSCSDYRSSTGSDW
uniref:EF-hand domain-containing protein n=1 Tax=Tetradesmus obliquus TaxID=3088 RepID=A0A383VRV8_TETOB|eukprot:jgi/Sobl393_1/2536/SZX67569.1